MSKHLKIFEVIQRGNGKKTDRKAGDGINGREAHVRLRVGAFDQFLIVSKMKAVMQKLSKNSKKIKKKIKKEKTFDEESNEQGRKHYVRPKRRG